MLFVGAMLLLAWMPRETNCGYHISKGQRPVDYLLYMDDLWTITKGDTEIDDVVDAFGEDINLQVDLAKHASASEKKGKLVQTDGIQVNKGAIQDISQSSPYKYPGIMELSELQHKEVNEEVREDTDK